MSDKPNFMTHERIMAGEEYVSYSDYLSLQRERDEAREAFKISYNERVQMELDRDEVRKKYDTLAVENMLEVHKLCKERDEWAAMCGRYKQERDDAMDIIRKAKAKFCEDGEDGKIASEMFSILIGNI